MPTRTSKRAAVRLTGGVLAILTVWGLGSARAHVDSPYLPEECGSCHVGHGMSGQPMLDHAEEEFCYRCHGSSADRMEMVAAGRLAAAANPLDIETQFKKPFRHPVEEGGGHSPVERLTAFKGSAVSHAECVDCHNPHQRIEGGRKQVYEVSGYSLAGVYLETSLYEYEVCLKCHADIRGFDTSADRSLLLEFSTAVRSQHPVTRGASGAGKPSLSRVSGQGERMNCSDCHTNDDPNGPRGPHGSNYRFMLSGNYNTDPWADESPLEYEFCYSCHDRTSLLSNESFPYHREHIVGDPIAGRPGTSCYTCHASHGSEDAPHLIHFNPRAVSRSGATGLIRYVETGDGQGECYLSCHGFDHEPERY